MKMSSYFVLLLALSQPLFSETVSQKRLAQLPKLHQLKKITVGPRDNFQSAVKQDGTQIYYTEKIHLSPRILSLNLQSGLSHEFLEISADSEQATLSPDNSKLAFVYYRNQARGEICVQGLHNSNLFCVPNEGYEVSSPFWIGNESFGFLRKPLKQEGSEVLVFDLVSSKQRVLYQGAIAQTTSNHSGSQLILVRETGRLELLDLKDKKPRLVALNLPGISAFPQYSLDDTFLYFTQYFDDTNGDQVTDARDNGVLFRLNMQSGRVEQLTPGDLNCSYPNPSLEALYVTCDFEGSLDIYQMPPSGLVPANWSEERLLRSISSIRSIEERILLWNALKSRFNKPDEPEYLKRQLANSLQLEHLTSTEFFIQNLPSTLKKDFSHLPLFLKAKVIFSKLSNHETLLRSTKNLKEVLDQTRTQASGTLLERELLICLYEIWLGENSKAFPFLKQINPQTWKVRSQNTLEAYWLFQILKTAGHKIPRELSQQLMATLISDELLDEQALVFYTLFALENIHEVTPLLQKTTGSVVKTLLESEGLIQQMLKEVEPAKKKSLFLKLDQTLNANRNLYHLSRGIISRATNQAALQDDFFILDLVSMNWLRYQKSSDTEFAFAREMFINATLERGYDLKNQGDLNKATSHFYGSVTATDSLEAHYAFLESMLASGQSHFLDSRYEFFLERGFTDENSQYAKALLKILKEKDPTSTTLESSLKDLLNMQHGGTEAPWHLALGAIYLHQFLNQVQKSNLPEELFQKSHRALSLALDLGRSNPRLRTSALMNLGILHQKANNFGQSVLYFERALTELPEDSKAQIPIRYQLARSLFFLSEYQEAAQVLKPIRSDLMNDPLLDLWSLNLLYAGDSIQALKVYERLLSNPAPPRNKARYLLNSGFAYFRLGDIPNSQRTLESARAALEDLGPEDPIAYYRMQIEALGLLAQTVKDPKREFEIRSRLREKLLTAKDHLDEIQMKLENWQQFLLKNDFHILRAQTELQLQNIQSEPYLQEIEQHFLQLAKSPSERLSLTLFESFSNHHLWYLHRKEKPHDNQLQKWSESLSQVLETYDRMSLPEPTLIFRKLKMLLLQASLEGREKELHLESRDDFSKLLMMAPDLATRLVRLKGI